MNSGWIAFLELKSPYTDEQSKEFINTALSRGTYRIVKNKETGNILALKWFSEIRTKELLLGELTLTPTDVERQLVDKENLDFNDLKAMIKQISPDINEKRLAVELNASTFFRGASFNGMNLIDTFGKLLGYSTKDMDYLFLTGKLPDTKGDTTDYTLVSEQAIYDAVYNFENKDKEQREATYEIIKL